MIWRSKRDRLPQPPMVAAERDPERHAFGPAAVVVCIALVLLVCGATRTTSLETADEGNAREHELVGAFAHGGLRLAPPPTPPDLSSIEDPAEASAALERFARQEAELPKIKYVVHTGAVDPCPT